VLSGVGLFEQFEYAEQFEYVEQFEYTVSLAFSESSCESFSGPAGFVFFLGQ
jgi:hypothetical protein